MTTSHVPTASNAPRRARRHPLRSCAVAAIAVGSIAVLGAAMSAGSSSASAFKRFPRPGTSLPVLAAPAAPTTLTVVHA
jgi:hypothetical protein